MVVMATGSEGSFQQEENEHVFRQVLQIISEESHIPTYELDDDTVLAEVGINHFLWHIVTDRMLDELGIDAKQKDVSDLIQLKDLRAFLPLLKAPCLVSSPATLSSISWDSPIDTPSTIAWERSNPVTPKAVPPATSLILQGTLLLPRKLFLFPDASGSAISYGNLPRVATDVTVYGLNSPFLRNPEAISCTFDDLVVSFLAEVQRRQPEGPYDLAGWSAGGALAFRCAQILLSQGEKINSLILIDAPLPDGVGKIPERLCECIEANGVFKGANGKTASWIMPNFRAMMELLPTMRIERTSYAAIPNVRILWGSRSFPDGKKDIIAYEKRPDDSKITKFLAHDRHDFGPCGWAFLLPGSKIWTGKTDADHFSIMKPPHSHEVSSCIREAMK